MNQISHMAQFINQAAESAGFGLSGIASVHSFPELNHLAQWIDSGHAGEMKYMKTLNENGALQRQDARSIAPWAKSVIVCAINYNTAHPYSTQGADSNRGWVSRYAWGHEDYHKSVMRRLRVVESKLRKAFEDSISRDECKGNRKRNPVSLETRCYVDTGPIVERVYAKYAGIGWIGKNTCILNQKLGSWLFLGVIVTSLELEPDLPVADRCGTCTRCIQACPTNAFTGPYQLDATKCISYLTIEKRGAIPEELRSGMGRHVFGCDICQDVCPWNRKAPATTAMEFQPRKELVNPALEWLAQVTEEEFGERFRGSPIRRAKATGLRRNAVVAMGNSGDRRFSKVLEQLKMDKDAIVAEHARWALGRLE